MNRYMIIIVAIFIFTIIVFAVFNNNGDRERADIKSVNANEFNDLLSSGNNLVVVDFRTPEEFSEGSIASAINIDFNSFSFKSKLEKLEKEKEYLIYCRNGNRSGQALEIMKNMGFKNVTNLSGGILSWTNSGYSLNICRNC